MELSERLLTEIKDAFNGVDYGKVTFFISPAKKTLDYTVETSHKLIINEYENIIKTA